MIQINLTKKEISHTISDEFSINDKYDGRPNFYRQQQICYRSGCITIITNKKGITFHCRKYNLECSKETCREIKYAD